MFYDLFKVHEISQSSQVKDVATMLRLSKNIETKHKLWISVYYPN